jgi:hypothetical protein
MRLVMISLTAMTVSSACVAVLFVHALIAPTKPALPDWTTTVADASHIAPTRRWVDDHQARMLSVKAR